MKLHMKFFGLVFSVVIGVCMTLVMSCFSTIMNVGFGNLFLVTWLKSFVAGLVVALPFSLICIPLLRKALLVFFDQSESKPE